MFGKILFYSIGLILIWVFLSQCVLMKNRWSDDKAYKIFSRKKVPLIIHDTVVNNSHLHYAISGSDTLPTLVFIHGSPGSWMNYAKYMWDSSLQKKFRMVALDRPGFGYSNFGKALHLREQCAIILPVLNSLQNGRLMYLFGHSMGGPVVVQLAASRPELFAGIIIAAGAIDVEQEEPETWRKIMSHKPLYWALPGAFAPSNTELLYLKKDLVPLQDEFKKVTCKVHFIHGTKDTWVPFENVAFGKRMMKNAESISVDTIAGADHQIPWKNRDHITNELLRICN
jgi:pimeloyl-ACP methyl ester carboxylesterase